MKATGKHPLGIGLLATDEEVGDLVKYLRQAGSTSVTESMADVLDYLVGVQQADGGEDAYSAAESLVSAALVLRDYIEGEAEEAEEAFGGDA